MIRLARLATFGLLTLAFGARGGNAEAEEVIKIGQTLPYSGPMSGFAAIGRAEEAYFAKLNAEGGVNGRKIKFISLDDAYSPAKTVEQTRKLVEQEEVLFLFGTLGTATNSSVHRYLNGKKVPQLFVLSGAAKWADPNAFPWTMSGMATYELEGAIYAKYILQTKPNAKIAILSQNDDFGRDYLTGFKRALAGNAEAMIISEATYESGEPTIASQLAVLKASGANVLLGVTLGKFTSLLIKGVTEIGWKPDMMFVPTSASSVSLLLPAGLENAVGLLSSNYQKDVSDEQWAHDDDVQAYFAFMKESMPGSDPRNSNYAVGYLNAHLMAYVLKACGNDVSRENILRQATSLDRVTLPLLLPGVTVTTGKQDYQPFEQMRLRRFNGKSWDGFGELLDNR